MDIHLGGGAGVSITLYPRGRRWIWKLVPAMVGRQVVGMENLGGGGCGFRGIRISPAHLPCLCTTFVAHMDQKKV